jgi:hypothetical protein
MRELEQDLGDMFMLFRIVLRSSVLGWATKRKRQFTIGIHRRVVATPTITRTPSTTLSLSDLEAFISATFCRGHSYTHAAYLVASEDEVQAELEWAQQRKDVLKRWARGKHFGDTPGSFAAALIENERERMSTYMDMGRIIFDVGQTPNSMGDASGRAASDLMCLTRSMGLLFYPSRGRWMVVSELLLAMGFPIHERHEQICKTSFMFTRRSATSASSGSSAEPCASHNRRAISQMVGNAMHVNSIGCVLFSLLLLEPSIGVKQNASLSRFANMVAQRRVAAKRAFSDL